MNLQIYRIFDALGDSVILCTYFKKYDIKEVYYNRAELKTLKKIIKIFNIEEPKFIPIQERIESTMVDVVLKLRADKVKLLNPNISVAPSNYITLQLKSKNESAKDRSADIQEFDSIVELSDYEKMNASDCKSITELIELLKGSRKHISIDSGTAWLAAAMGLDTVVLSKNSYYFSDAYHYMRYLNIQKNVKVHQQNNSGVKIPSEEEYTRLATSNGVFKPYSQYLSEVKRI